MNMLREVFFLEYARALRIIILRRENDKLNTRVVVPNLTKTQRGYI